MQIGFDKDKYIKLQASHIRERINQFGGKLYLEFGGKLFDDYHASRVLPGFEPDLKARLLEALAPVAEALIAINANDIEQDKRRSDIGIPYSEDALRLMDAFRSMGLVANTVVITHFTGQPHVEAYQRRLEKMGIKVARHYLIDRYPADIDLIVSEDGFGKNDFVATTRPLVVVSPSRRCSTGRRPKPWPTRPSPSVWCAAPGRRSPAPSSPAAGRKERRPPEKC